MIYTLDTCKLLSANPLITPHQFPQKDSSQITTESLNASASTIMEHSEKSAIPMTIAKN